MNTVILSPAEKKKLLTQVFGEGHHSVGKSFPVFSKWMDKLDKFNDVVSMIELLPGINTLLSSPGASALVSNASFAGVLLFPVSQIINVMNARQSGHRLYSYRCIAYTITAWTFDLPFPRSSETILRNIHQGDIVQPKRVDLDFKRVWQETSHNVISRLNQIVDENRIPKKNMQLVYRSMSDGSPNSLNLEILKTFEDKLSFPERIVWKSNYKIKYGE